METIKRFVLVDHDAGMYPLHLAAGLGDAKAVRELLAAGESPLLLDRTMGASPLHYAAQSGSIEIGQLLLDSGAFINLQVPTHGMTPLMVAVWHRKPEFVEFLLARPDINVDTKSQLGATAEEMIGGGERRTDKQNLQDLELKRLFVNFRQQRADLLKRQLLFQILAAEDLSDGEIESQVVENLQKGAEPNTVSPMLATGNAGHTPLLIAARQGYVDAVKGLLEAGADMTLVGGHMLAHPAHKAGYMGRPDIMRLLSENGQFTKIADIQGPFNGYTALHDAVWHGHTEAVRVLLDAGVRKDLRGYDGKSAYDLAREYGYDDIVQLLE